MNWTLFIFVSLGFSIGAQYEHSSVEVNCQKFKKKKSFWVSLRKMYSCLENPMDGGAWWAAVHGVVKSRTRLSDFTFTFHFHALEKEMATHSSVLAWRIPGTGEPGGLLSMGSNRVGHDWSDLAAAAAAVSKENYRENSKLLIKSVLPTAGSSVWSRRQGNPGRQRVSILGV